MIGLWIILAHLVGDYCLQSHWMAVNKTSRWWPAIVHGVTYTLPYGLITQSPWALLTIAGTHVIIDRYRLARHLGFLKNLLAPRVARAAWEDSKTTGYPSTVPVWLSTWLMIVTDNTIHLLINTFAVLYL